MFDQEHGCDWQQVLFENRLNFIFFSILEQLLSECKDLLAESKKGLLWVLAKGKHYFEQMGGYFPIRLVLMRDGFNKVNLLEEFILIALKNYHQKLFKSNDCLLRNLIFAQSNQLHNWGLEESLVVTWQNLIVLIFNLKLR